MREAKALMLVHQYELFKTKDDESIDDMYSRFQTLVSGPQILKKSYVASDHVSKILISLPARWRPKVTAIEEAKDLNTLSVEDLISSLKVHELSVTPRIPTQYKSYLKSEYLNIYGMSHFFSQNHNDKIELLSVI